MQTTTAAAPTTDTTFTVAGPNPDRFVDPATKAMREQLVMFFFFFFFYSFIRIAVDIESPLLHKEACSVKIQQRKQRHSKLAIYKYRYK